MITYGSETIDVKTLKQIHGDIENNIRDTNNSYTLDADDKMFLNLKWMFDTKVLTSDDFKNIVDKYKDNSNTIMWGLHKNY